MSDHHVLLDGDWVLWNSVCVRGAGFAAVEVLRLAAPASAAAADRLLDEEDRFERLRKEMVEACRRVLAPTATRGAALKRLYRGEVPTAPTGEATVDALLDELTGAQAARETARHDLKQVMLVEQKQVGERLREIAASPRFQQALLLQNRTALSVVAGSLAQSPAGSSDTKTREREAFVARYLMRYAVKNDSVSFFGPVGWATITNEGPAADAHPGPSLLARRLMFFEYWCIDALAGVIAQDERLRPQIVPRRMPTVRVENNVLHLGLGRTAAVPEVFAALLLACDGERSASAIAEKLCAEESYELSGPDEVYELLGELAEKKLVVWSFEIPTNDLYPERALRALLERLEPGDAKDGALAMLEELEASRAAVVSATGDLATLERALIDLDETFTRLAGTEAIRRAGKMYAARTLLHEDCVRDLQLSLGPAFVAALAPSLSLLLQSARWYTFELARTYSELFEQTWARLSPSGEEIEYVAFFSEIASLLAGSSFDSAPEPVRSVTQRHESQWAELLQVGPSERRVERTAEQLRSAVERVFAAPHGGWPSARFHSPDLTIAAKSVDHIARGEFEFVLGELHVGSNAITSPSMLELHSDMRPLIAAHERDNQGPQVAPVATKEQTNQANWYSVVPIDYQVETGTARSTRPRDRVLALGELVVVRHQGKLVVRTRDGRASFDLLAFLDLNLTTSTLQHFRVLPRTKHSPRVTIDKMVVSRERWAPALDEIPFARLPTAMERFVGARRWARALGIPRFAFYRTPEEVKPLFVDFESPTYTEILAHTLRSASSFSITEMLPDIDDSWLPDREGNRYTCELRMTALDLAPMK